MLLGDNFHCNDFVATSRQNMKNPGQSHSWMLKFKMNLTVLNQNELEPKI